MSEAGYSEPEAAAIKAEVSFYENLRSQVKIHSGDALISNDMNLPCAT